MEGTQPKRLFGTTHGKKNSDKLRVPYGEVPAGIAEKGKAENDAD